VQAPLLDRDAFEEDEAFAVDDLLPDGAEEGRELGEREQGLGDAGERRAGGDVSVGGTAEFGDLVLAEDVNPSFRVGAVVFGLPYGGACDFLREGFVWWQEGVDGRMLAGCFQAVREDTLVHNLAIVGLVASQRVWCRAGRLGQRWCHGSILAVLKPEKREEIER